MRPISPNAAVPSRTGDAARRRGDRERDPEVGARLVDADAAGDVDEHVGAAERQPGVAGEHREDHREPLGVDAGGDPPRHREVARRDERLDLEQQRPRALDRAGDGGADLARLAAAEERRGVGHADEPGAGHLEHAELVRRAEAVLDGPQDAMGVVAVALELEHAVDEVLEHARPGDGAVLRHVADEERRDARLLRRRAGAGSPPRAPARPSPGVEPSSAAYSVCTESITQTSGRSRSSVAQTASSSVSARISTCSQPPSRAARSFTCATDSSPVTSSARLDCEIGAERHQEQRRLADARLAADEHERRRHEPAAEHAVELVDTGRDPRRLLGDDVDEAKQRPRLGRLGAARRCGLLDHRPERAAARAAPEPPAGDRAALGARVLDGRCFRHAGHCTRRPPTASVPAS